MSLYIGLMSGTSADAIDAALVDFSRPRPQLLASYSLKLPDSIRRDILDLFNPGDNEIERLGVLDRELGHLFAKATHHLLKLSNVAAEQVTAIGCHGQTLRHRPRLEPTSNSFSLQIGDPNTIATLTGITTLADFRRRDLAAGGQGAPLTPAFHQAMFGSRTQHRGVLNLGGIANITYLPADSNTCVGFDTGPANGLLDYWIGQYRQVTFDADGAWAASGQVDTEFLQQLRQHPYFALSPPKSTGKEEFTPAWLNTCIDQCIQRPAAADIQATLLELTAISICDALTRFCAPLDELFLCGGGALNTQLRLRLAQLLPRVRLSTTDELGIGVLWVEAMAFAWLAMRTLQGLSGNLPAVTGAQQAVVLGGIYPGTGFKTDWRSVE